MGKLSNAKWCLFGCLIVVLVLVASSIFVPNKLTNTVNFVIGYALIFGVGKFVFGFTIDVLMVGIGALVTAVGLARQFGRLRSR